MTAGFLSPVFDFTSQDYLGVYDDLTRFAVAQFPNELWTDFNDSNIGTYHLREMAYATDLVSYQTNAAMLETVAATVVREQNFRNLARTFDFAMFSATPSTTTLRFSQLPTPGGADYPFTISARHKIAIGDIIFQPLVSVTVTSGSVLSSISDGYYTDVAVIQGDEVFEEVVGTSTGKPGQRFDLQDKFVIDDELTVTVGAAPYTIVSNFVDETSTSESLMIDTLETGETTLIFGDNINGKVPPTSAQILATYKTGGGTETNQPAGLTTWQMAGTSSDAVPVPTALTGATITNIVAATGGGNRQTLAAAQKALPGAIAANNRAVTAPDYAALAVSEVSGVFRASAVPGRAVGGQRAMILFIVPNGGGAPTSTLANLISIGLQDLKMARKRIQVRTPVYVDIVIEVDLYVQAAAFASIVTDRLSTILLDEFDLENVDFADVFSLQDLYDTAKPSRVEGSTRVFFRRFSVTPYYARHTNTPSTGNGIVEEILTSELVRRREWLIRVRGPEAGILVNQYVVLQRRLGTVSFITDTLLTDDSGAYDVDDLVGQYVHPNPEESPTTYLITANTRTSMTTAGDMLAVTSPGDPYVVEATEPMIGKLLRSTSTAITATASVTVGSSASWEAGDLVLVRTAGGVIIARGEVASIPDATHIVLTATVSVIVGSTLDYMWQSEDESVSFVVTQGSTVFSVGDEVYVDTYGQADDLQLRPENFPLFAGEDLTINTIGGVRLCLPRT